MADVNTILLVAILLLVALSLMVRSSQSNSGSVKRVERKLDAILSQLGIDADADIDPQLKRLMLEGRKIDAIKLYREQAGVGLKEAKDYVESL